MKSDADHTNAKPLQALKSILLFYIFWTIVSVSVATVLRYLKPETIWYFGLSVIMLPTFILLASFSGIHFKKNAEPFFAQRHRTRILTLCLCTGLLVGCYFLVRFTGFKSSIIYSFATANLLMIANLLGNWMIFPLKKPAEIIPLCFVASLADLFSVFAGPTKEIVSEITTYYQEGMAGTPPFADFLLIKIPMPGFDTLTPLFGVSDWIIVVFLSAAINKFGLTDNITAIAPVKKAHPPSPKALTSGVLGLIFALIIARWTGAFIPALPVVILVFLTVTMYRYPEMRKLTRSELQPMAIFGMGMILLLLYINRDRF